MVRQSLRGGTAFAALLMVGALFACAHPARLSIFDEAHRPRGYRWKAHRIPRSTAVEYYGTDPASGRTVYVGPDGIYYCFPHGPPITTADLHSYWDPHDAPPREPLPLAGLRPGSATHAALPRADRTRCARRTPRRPACAAR